MYHFTWLSWGSWGPQRHVCSLDLLPKVVLLKIVETWRGEAFKSGRQVIGNMLLSWIWEPGLSLLFLLPHGLHEVNSLLHHIFPPQCTVWTQRKTEPSSHGLKSWTIITLFSLQVDYFKYFVIVKESWQTQHERWNDGIIYRF